MDKTSELNIVTGALGFTGKYITSELLSANMRVKSLTGHPNRPNKFGNAVELAPFNFENPRELIKSLAGATTIYNTYWIRFEHKNINFEKAIENTMVLINAAKEAGVQKIVHISITNASETSPLPYFRGKGLVEKKIIESGLPYAIIRPTVIFGAEDILINNIAWFLKKFSMFAIPGNGSYKLQPVFVKDVAKIAVNAAAGAAARDNTITDAVGPEIFTFEDLVQKIANVVNNSAKITRVPAFMALRASKILGLMTKDVVLTEDEMKGLMNNLLTSKNTPLGTTKLSEWLVKNSESIGTSYASELKRHFH